MESRKVHHRSKTKSQLDPQAEALLRELAKVNLSFDTLAPPEARKVMRMLLAPTTGPGELAKVEDVAIPGPAGKIPVRIYTPRGSGLFPVLVFFHGGGWVVGDLETHDNLCRSFAKRVGCVVASVDYRLAPEHKFPAAVEDAYAATKWVAQNASLINVDPARIAVGGDSAGGNLATVVAILARDRNEPKLVFQLLIYAALDLSRTDRDSYRDFAEGYFLTVRDGAWFLRHYLNREEDSLNPLISPLLTPNLSDLPPALVITAECDILRDEGESYAKRLEEAGVAVKCTRYKGMIHGFMSMEGFLDKASDGIEEASAVLREAFVAP